MALELSSTLEQVLYSGATDHIQQTPQLCFMCVLLSVHRLWNYLGDVCFSWLGIVGLDLCLIFEKELKHFRGREEERIWKNLGDSKNIIK